MDPGRKRYRAFISYSQRDKQIARGLHRALEAYRVPAGVGAQVGADRGLGRFFRDDDEMGASQSLGAALEGALDDSENLIVICSPSAAKSKWVDAEVRRFKRRSDGRVFAVIVAGEPHASDPARECFPPALKVRIDNAGNLTQDPDEPRAPDLRHESLARVRAQLAAGLLDVPFDDLWQRDRRRALRNRTLASTGALVVVAVLGVVVYGWLAAQSESRMQAADEAIVQARSASADGRIGEALNRLAPFLAYRETRQRVEAPLRTMLAWVPDPYTSVMRAGFTTGQLRDATVLLDPGKGVYDVSDVGMNLQRLIRSRDGRRLVAIGDQRVAVFDAKSGQRLSQMDNDEVHWVGHGFEAPTGLMVVTGAVMGPTNGSVRPFVLTIPADGKSVQRVPIDAPVFFGSAVGVTPKCEGLLVAIEDANNAWRLEARTFTAAGLGEKSDSAPRRSNASGVAAFASVGTGFETRDAFLGEAKVNPFVASGCLALGMDDGFSAGDMRLKGARVLVLEPALALEAADRWSPATVKAGGKPVATYLPNCTEAKPCRVVGGRVQQTFVRDDLPTTDLDQIGSPPPPRWSRKATPTAEIYFQHRVFNSGHELVVCRPQDGKDVCLMMTAMGEDQLNLPFLRSPQGRYLYWPFGGSVFDLDTLQPLTAARALPRTEGRHFDFDLDRAGLTFAFDGRLVSFVADSAGRAWIRTDDERASPRFGILVSGPDERPLHTLASLGGRQYLAVRSNGVMGRLDATSGRELWRLTAAGLGEIEDVQLDDERRHVLLIGKSAWRVFRLDDGFPLSGLLAPPPMLSERDTSADNNCQAVIGPQGDVVAVCGKAAFAWQPRAFAGDIEPQLGRLVCATEVKASALETIRRCYVDR